MWEFYLHLLFLTLIERKRVKASDEAIYICKISVLGRGMVSWKNRIVFTKCWVAYGISFSLKILCAPCRILRKLSWKFWFVLVHFVSPLKFRCVLVPFLVLLENLLCFYKEFHLLLENSYVSFKKKPLLEKKNRIF